MAMVRLAAMAGLLLAAGAASAQSGSGDPAANWEQVAACARHDRASERHACIDGVLRAAGLLDRGREIAEQRETFGEQRRDPPAPPPPPAAVAAPPSAAPPVLEELATTVSRAFDPGNRLMVIITEEGQVWQQNESKDLGLPPRPGTRFVIEKGALGSFNCRIGGGRTFRCRRHD